MSQQEELFAQMFDGSEGRYPVADFIDESPTAGAWQFGADDFNAVDDQLQTADWPEHGVAALTPSDSDSPRSPERYENTTKFKHNKRGSPPTVFTASDRETNQTVFLKLVCTLEHDILSSLQETHPKVVRILDSGSAHLIPAFQDQQNYACFIAMPVYKHDLFYFLETRTQLSTERILTLIAESAWALHMLHAQGYFHGDVKLENFLLDWNDNVYLADFEHAVRIGHQTSMIGGTHQYRAPEAGLVPYSAANEVYSLGVMLNKLCEYCHSDSGAADSALVRELSDGLLARSVEDRWTLEQALSWFYLHGYLS